MSSEPASTSSSGLVANSSRLGLRAMTLTLNLLLVEELLHSPAVQAGRNSSVSALLVQEAQEPCFCKVKMENHNQLGVPGHCDGNAAFMWQRAHVIKCPAG